MRFEILGGLAVCDGPTRIDVPGAKQRALLALLLLNRDKPLPADRIIDELWGHDPPAKALNALQAKVSSLRSALAAGDPDRGRALIEARDGGYLLRVPDDSVDAARFDNLVAGARRAMHAGQPVRGYGLLDEALSVWSGEPLPEFGDYTFATLAADRLTALWLTAREMHASAWLSVGGPPGLPDELVDILSEHPLRESLRALVMRTLARQGRQAQALEVYADGRRLLRDELGIDPGPELRSAHAEVLAQRPAEPLDPCPSERKRTLPAESTAFIGRRSQRTQLELHLGRARLVSVTGPGGVGKTRLVVHTLAGVTAPADGIWFTDLRGAHGPGAVAGAVLQTYRDRQGANLGADDTVIADVDHDPAQRLRDRIGSREMILVLDNSEHVVDEVTALARQLLAECPGLRLVITTRVLLGLPEEAVLRLDPLPCPPADAPRDVMLAAESVALFCSRARLDAETLSTPDLRLVTEIVRRADGMPLAIEVASGLLRGLSLSDVAANLRHNEPTLAATIDRSWQLLDAAETDLLSRVSIIEGPWCLDGPRALTDAAESEVAAIVARLVDRSLISYDASNSGTPYRLLDTIRDYASRKLAQRQEREEVVGMHARYFQRLAQETDTRLRGSQQPAAFARFVTAHADISTAIETFLAEGRYQDAVRTANSLGWYWWLSGRRREGRAVLTKVLAVAGRDATARAWAGALGFSETDSDAAVADCVDIFRTTPVDEWDIGLRLVAILTTDRLYQRGQPEVADEIVHKVTGIADETGDGWLTAATRLMTGVGASWLGRPRRGYTCAQAALAGFTAAGDLWGQAQSLDLLAQLDEGAGKYTEARQARERVRDVAQALGMADTHAYQLARIGNLHALAGDLDAAQRYLLRAQALGEELGFMATVAYADNGLGMVLRRAGRPYDAKVRHEAALRHYRKVGSTSGVAFTCAVIGLAASAFGDHDDARDWHRSALVAASRTKDRRAIALVLEGLAVADGPTSVAAELLGAARALRTGAGAPRPAGEIPEVDLLEAELPGDAHAALAAGAAWSADIGGIPERVERLIVSVDAVEHQ